VKIGVHIERLVLEGLPVTARQGAKVQEALERELARALANGGLSRELRAGGAFLRVQAPAVRLPGSDPAAAGERIAQTIHRGIGSIK
jgi:hypothetical protein